MSPKPLIVLACLAILATVPGCGSSAPAAVSDPALGRTVLKETLDAWKKGEAPASVKTSSGQVLVVDEEWQSGAKLADYTIDDDRLVGTSVRAMVTLTVQPAKGKPVKRKVAYNVMTAPLLRIDREE